jgi:hypothetical protein
VDCAGHNVFRSFVQQHVRLRHFSAICPRRAVPHIFRACFSSQLSDATVVMIVFDTSSSASFDNCGDWLQQARSDADAPLLCKAQRAPQCCLRFP